MATYNDIEQFGLLNIQNVKANIDHVGALNLTLVRRWFTSNSSIGKLLVNGLLYCYTLEDVTREDGVKIKKETAIPYGVYSVAMTTSAIAYKWNTPQNLLPLLENVPGFSGIRIHPGQKKEHTEGCILVGFGRTTDKIEKSTKAFWPLFDLIYYCHQKGYPIKIKVTNYERRFSIILLIVGVIIVTIFAIKYFLKTKIK